jgi:hypothetical protein
MQGGREISHFTRLFSVKGEENSWKWWTPNLRLFFKERRLRMKVLLAIDGSLCSLAAVKEVATRR